MRNEHSTTDGSPEVGGGTGPLSHSMDKPPKQYLVGNSDPPHDHHAEAAPSPESKQNPGWKDCSTKFAR